MSDPDPNILDLSILLDNNNVEDSNTVTHASLITTQRHSGPGQVNTAVTVTVAPDSDSAAAAAAAGRASTSTPESDDKQHNSNAPDVEAGYNTTWQASLARRVSKLSCPICSERFEASGGTAASKSSLLSSTAGPGPGAHRPVLGDDPEKIRLPYIANCCGQTVCSICWHRCICKYACYVFASVCVCVCVCVSRIVGSEVTLSMYHPPPPPPPTSPLLQIFASDARFAIWKSSLEEQH
jgi:hypothetical protein